MPLELISRTDLLRRYLEQNGITSFGQPISMEQSLALDQLKILYSSPADFKQAILEWDAEQKEKEEEKRNEFLEEQQSERMKRLNSETSLGRITLAKGKQTQLENSELARIKETFQVMEKKRDVGREIALKMAKEQKKYVLQLPLTPASSEIIVEFREIREGIRQKYEISIPSPPKPKERDIPMAPDTKKRRIILRD